MQKANGVDIFITGFVLGFGTCMLVLILTGVFG